MKTKCGYIKHSWNNMELYTYTEKLSSLLFYVLMTLINCVKRYVFTLKYSTYSHATR